MVKVGFIVEGDTESIILNHPNFDDFLLKFGLEKVGRAIKSGDEDKEGGKDNMKPNHQKVTRNINSLFEQGAEFIFFIRDLEDLPCITSAKDEIHTIDNGIKIISVKAFDAFFLADSITLSKLLNQEKIIENPEEIDNPLEYLRNLFIEIRGINKGIGNRKTKIANLFAKNDFSFENAAVHSKSAKYFLNKLQEISNTQ